MMMTGETQKNKIFSPTHKAVCQCSVHENEGQLDSRHIIIKLAMSWPMLFIFFFSHFQSRVVTLISCVLFPSFIHSLDHSFPLF